MSLVRKTLAMGAFSALAAAQAPKTTADCLDAVIFNTRGNNAPYHDWRTAPLLDAVCAKLNAEGKTCDYIDVEFDAPLGGDYCAQVAQGVRNGVAELTAYNKKCPCTHIIISGYSEGAHILGDILAGPGGCNFVFEGLDNTTRPGNAIAAAMLWGDALHVAGQPYNVLDGANKQKSPRNPTELARLNRYSNVLRSWCDAKDPVCAGGNDGTAHSTYFMKYSDSAADWVMGKIHSAAPLCPTSSSSAMASSTASSSAASSAAASSAASSVAASSSATATSAAGSKASAAAASSGASSGASKPTAAASSSGAPTATKTGSAPPAESTCAKANFPAPIPYEEKCVQVVTIKYVQAKKPM
ncbi:hypothetical protein TUN199_06663 [Pyrenophora tritici-repentis]|uniref:Cutinase n=2 Tax=Pyrenophora tritici-repentis TaxID=45151 RepID=A0A2W1HBP5_9PLEO|nr:uncharacterized protein PTRG_09347 [Pyrenophora tritici-repentis Pt-1C-BFP]KAA8617492.1 Cutinase multi-domain protein [Pyrenophora tritici-repentis]EDU42398.1 conserved hypothetical protein [Pyrenophora tritici-repentis Pt-1C-BFP]KAF7441930.1 Cutinase multi-domain protein [Pyrenophora tritici-repentis]KAF7567941.1 Cutinase multi-domain protein [Pyrenophora tritici-repentis]KAI0577349.1 Cutinase multi-domain protein [Pyrenophora tritici-repentis]